jgi:hypothetical protein
VQVLSNGFDELADIQAECNALAIVVSHPDFALIPKR